VSYRQFQPLCFDIIMLSVGLSSISVYLYQFNID